MALNPENPRHQTRFRNARDQLIRHELIEWWDRGSGEADEYVVYIPDESDIDRLITPDPEV